MIIGKCTGQSFTLLKQWKSARSSDGSLDSDQKRAETDLSISTTQIPAENHISLPNKRKSRRKMDRPRPFLKVTSHAIKLINQNKHSTSSPDTPLYPKVIMSLPLKF